MFRYARLVNKKLLNFILTEGFMAKHNVIVYSTTACPWCYKAKEFLREHHIEFKDINVGEDRQKAQEMVEKSGQMGVPVLDIDGKIIIGFDKVAIKKALDIA